MPFAFVDLDLFDANIRDLVKRAGNKTVRVASKSVRCLPLMKRILESESVYKGIMSFSAPETAFLSRAGFDDIVMGYPIWNEKDVTLVAREVSLGKKLIFMVDSVDHVEHLAKIGEKLSIELPLCIDIDLSSSYPGLHFGVRRSGITTPDHALSVARRIRDSACVRLVGVMGYEAQIAGLPDTAPANFLKNRTVRFLKGRSIKELARRRDSIVRALYDDGFSLDFVNGGGTGCMESTREEDCITEITAGSAFYSPSLFDHYLAFRHHPAAGFAIEITRMPVDGVYTCLGGGYVASGAVGADKVPQPFLPEGAKLLPPEMAGEVQTPIRYDGPTKLGLGDPIFMRHGKAGELCERFNEVFLVKGGAIVDEVKTYRGEGECFL